MSLTTIKKIARQNGFQLHRSTAQLPFARDLWVASFTSRAGTKTP